MSADFDTKVRLALYGEFVRTAPAPTAESLAGRLAGSDGPFFLRLMCVGWPRNHGHAPE